MTSISLNLKPSWRKETERWRSSLKLKTVFRTSSSTTTTRTRSRQNESIFLFPTCHNIGSYIFLHTRKSIDSVEVVIKKIHGRLCHIRIRPLERVFTGKNELINVLTRKVVVVWTSRHDDRECRKVEHEKKIKTKVDCKEEWMKWKTPALWLWTTREIYCICMLQLELVVSKGGSDTSIRSRHGQHVLYQVGNSQWGYRKD